MLSLVKSQEALLEQNIILNQIAKKIISDAENARNSTGLKTLSANHMLTVALSLPGELAKGAHRDILRVAAKYFSK